MECDQDHRHPFGSGDSDKDPSAESEYDPFAQCPKRENRPATSPLPLSGAFRRALRAERLVREARSREGGFVTPPQARGPAEGRTPARAKPPLASRVGHGEN